MMQRNKPILAAIIPLGKLFFAPSHPWRNKEKCWLDTVY
jgi:hypothetical protein